MQILIKSLIFRTLQIYIFSFYAFLFFVSLADAEFGKDGIQYVLRRDFTGNSAQMVQNFADVLSEQVSGNASCKSILGPVRGSACGF